jgi:4-amino-4-deoxy-L-arabinose transferase-like glycosyltransferase
LTTFTPKRRSLAIITLAWLILQLSGIFSPGLLDDVDSIYIEIARQMLLRHNFVTPYIDGIRFFDKPPLMYWLASGSMYVFGEHDWAARIPLALGFLALLFATYALANRLFRNQQLSDRAGLYSALALATSIGPYLYTRFFIPDILIALWMTLGVHCFLIALERAKLRQSTLWPSLGFASTLALNVLTKGLIGLVFPIGFVLCYLLYTRQLRTLLKCHLILGTAVFLAIAAPWHILAALENPPISMPFGVGLPAKAGWAWFYLYNEHVARFFGRRIPHDYGQTPRLVFWLFAALWLFPWTAFFPGAISAHFTTLRTRATAASRDLEAALTLLLWPLLVLGFFTVASRQEYYSIPAFPALALLAGGRLARAELSSPTNSLPNDARRSALRWHLGLLLPLASLVAIVCATLAIIAPHPAPGTDLAALLASNPAEYNLSLGHLYDLRIAAMGFFRGPLILTALGMAILGPLSYVLRRAKNNSQPRNNTQRLFASNLTLAAGMVLVLLATHEAFVRFNPILGSKGLALAINQEQAQKPRANDLIVLDGELTSGSSLLFYTQQPAHLVNGRINGPWFGSFWPDAPPIFEDESSLRQLWASPRHIYLLTYHPTQRRRDLSPLGPVHILASAGGKTVLTNFTP